MNQNLSGLFEIYQQETHSFRHDAERIKNWLLSWKRAFCLSIAISLILHILLFGYISFSSYSLYRASEEPETIDLGPILGALAQIKAEPGNQGLPQRQISEIDETKLIKLLTQIPLFDSSISGKERKELSIRLMDSYLELKKSRPAGSVIPEITLRDLFDFFTDQNDLGLSERGRYYSPDRFSENMGPVFFRFDKKSERQLKHLRRLERYEREGTPVLGGMVTVSSEGGKKDVPAEYYFRDCPYDQILAKGANLFYAISGFPILNHESPTGLQLQSNGESNFQPGIYRNGLALYIIKAAKPDSLLPAAIKARPPFRTSANRIEGILDNLMEFPEDRQLELFSTTYLKKYDPDDSRLAKLSREFVHQNLSSVFVLDDPFSAAFDFLEELFYNKELQGYFLSYWDENPRTKTAVEFLLIVASLYDFERRAVAHLLDSYEIAKKILDGDIRFQRAFSQKAKALVVKEVCQEFVRELREMGMTSEEDVLQEYRNEQGKIYQMLIQIGGAARDRALYAWGRLFWNEGTIEAAVQKWKEISDTFNYQTYQEIDRLLSEHDSIPIPSAADYQALVQEINKIFEWESAENSSFLFKRLIKYDKWKKRTKR